MSKIVEKSCSEKYSFQIKKHTNKETCASISAIVCFLNNILHDCSCNYKHTVKLKEGYSFIEINNKCSCLWIIKKGCNFIRIILNNELV